MSRFPCRSRALAPLVLATVAFSLACGSDDEGAGPTPTITVTLNPTSATVQQGGSAQVTVTVTGVGGFTGTPTITAEGVPTGVSGSIANIQTSGSTTTATVTITVAANTVPGTYSITVRATGTGVTAVTTTFTLAVTAAVSGNYTLTTTPTAVSVTQGGAAQTSTININRSGGFTGSVALAVMGASSGLTATLNPTSTTGNSSTLTLQASASATMGTVTLTITGTATGLANQTTTVAVTVLASGGGGNVTINASACALTSKPIWLAFQNGTSGWTQVTGVADVYTFNITQSKGGVAWATQHATGTAVHVIYATQAELTSATFGICAVTGTKTVNGTVAGNSGGDNAWISLGGGIKSVGGNGPFTISNVQNGNQDLVAYRYNFLSPGTSDRVIIRRDQNIANNGSLGTLDFGATEAFAPAMATATVLNAGSDQVTPNMQYATTPACVTASLATNPTAGASFTMRGIPAGQQRATDFHLMFLHATQSQTASRAQFEAFKTLADRTFALGVPLPVPTVTSLTATYKRLQAALTLPSDYQSNLSLEYVQQGAAAAASVTATFGWLGGASATLAFPDFAGVSGWQNFWVPASSATVNWGVTAQGLTNTTGGLCVDGARFRIASVSGTN